eukprot:Em0005g1032a
MQASPCCVLRSLVAKAVLLLAAVQAQSSLEGNATLGTLGGTSSTQFQFPPASPSSPSSSSSSSDVLLTTTILGSTLPSPSSPQSAVITIAPSSSSEVSTAVWQSSNWIPTAVISTSVSTSAALQLTTAPITSLSAASTVSTVTTMLLAAMSTPTSLTPPFTAPASQMVPTSFYLTPTGTSSFTSTQVIIIGAGGGGAILTVALCVCCLCCCVCCCRRAKRRHSVKLMKKQDQSTNVLFIQNYNQAIIQEVAIFDAGISTQRHKPTTPVLTGHTLRSEHASPPAAHPILLLVDSINTEPDVRSTSAGPPPSLPDRGRRTPPNDRTSALPPVPTLSPSSGNPEPPDVHLNASVCHSALLSSKSQQVSQNIRPNSFLLPSNSSSNDGQHKREHITSTLPPKLHGKLPDNRKEAVPPEVRPGTDASTVQHSLESETKGLPPVIPAIVVIPEKGIEEVARPASTSLEPRKPVPLPRQKLIKAPGNSSEDQYVDPREFVRDRVLSIVLMENEAAVHSDDKAAGGEDLYVAMEHIREGSPPVGRGDAPVSPKYANVRNSFAGLSSREPPDSNKQQQKGDEEVYLQMTPEVQRQLRRSSDSPLSSNPAFQQRDHLAIKDNADEYMSVPDRGSLLEDVLSSYKNGAKDKVQLSWPKKHFEGQSIDGEELYYNFGIA